MQSTNDSDDSDDDMPEVPDFTIPLSLEEFWGKHLPIVSDLELLIRAAFHGLLDLREDEINTYCIEPVLKAELWNKFFTKACQLSPNVVPSEGLVYLRDFYLTYHGTAPESVESIIQTGFRMPGTLDENGNEHEIASGDCWGRGIYSTPASIMASYYSFDKTKRSTYSDDECIIVCAVALGRSHVCLPPPVTYFGKGVTPNFDSHISPFRTNYVVFNSDQIVPLCVFHVEDTMVHHYIVREGKPALTPEEISSYKTLYEGQVTEEEAIRMTNEENFRLNRL